MISKKCHKNARKDNQKNKVKKVEDDGRYKLQGDFAHYDCEGLRNLKKQAGAEMVKLSLISITG